MKGRVIMKCRQMTSAVGLLLVTLFTAGNLFAQGWVPGAPLNTARSNAAAVYLDGYIYVIGGTGSGELILNTVERYDMSSGQWDQSVASLDEPRSSAVAMVFDGKIHLISGIEEDGDSEDEVYIYDPAINQWQEGRRSPTRP